MTWRQHCFLQKWSRVPCSIYSRRLLRGIHRQTTPPHLIALLVQQAQPDLTQPTPCLYGTGSPFPDDQLDLLWQPAAPLRLLAPNQTKHDRVGTIEPLLQPPTLEQLHTQISI